MPAARKTAENRFRPPAPADRWIKAKTAVHTVTYSVPLFMLGYEMKRNGSG